MTTIVTRTDRARHLAAIVIAVALTLGFAAIASVGAEINDADDGIFARMGDYLAAMTEALGGADEFLPGGGRCGAAVATDAAPTPPGNPDAQHVHLRAHRIARADSDERIP
jgi:hypothetical protein